MKQTNHFAVVVCATEFAAAVGTVVFAALLGLVAVAGLFTPYTLFVSAALGVYLAFAGFTLCCLIAVAIGVLIFTILKRRTPNRIFLALGIAAAVLNLAALLFMTVPLAESAFSPAGGDTGLIAAIIAPLVACAADAAAIGFSIAALLRESRLSKEEQGIGTAK